MSTIANGLSLSVHDCRRCVPIALHGAKRRTIAFRWWLRPCGVPGMLELLGSLADIGYQFGVAIWLRKRLWQVEFFWAVREPLLSLFGIQSVCDRRARRRRPGR